MGFSGASAGFGLGMETGVTLLAVGVLVLGDGERADVTLFAGGGGLELVPRLALAREREAFNISFAEMVVLASGEVGDFGEVGVTLELDLLEAGLILELDFGEVGLGLFGLKEVVNEAEEVEVDWTASLTEETS